MSLIDSYRTHLKAAGRPRSTIYLRTWQLRRLAEHVDLAKATTADLAGYLAAQDWASTTLYSVRATMRDFYRYLVSARVVRRSPAEDLPPIRRGRRELPPAPEAVVAMASGDERVMLMVTLGARQGLRRSEIAKVHTRDLFKDLTGWSLVVHGKGDQQRVIPLHDDVAHTLRQLPHGWAFPSPNGGHLTPQYVGVLISQALPDGWTAHSLRRHFATTVFARSRNLRAVQMLLGHASLATTQQYVGAQMDDLRAAIAA